MPESGLRQLLPRMQVGTLTDAEPIADQLEPYYLLREYIKRQGGGTIPAPLEQILPGEKQPGRRDISPEEFQELMRIWNKQGIPT